MGRPRTDLIGCVRKWVNNLDEDNQALNDTVEVENNETTTPVVEEQATGEVEEDNDLSADESESETTETVEGSKKGFNNRVRELNERAKKAEAEAESLAQKLAALTGADNANGYGFDMPRVLDEPIVQAGEEIDALELDRRLRMREQRILQQADALSTLRTKQNDAVNRINNEAQAVLKKYPQLDPSSDKFNKELSDAITEATDVHVKNAPYTASVTKFVDKMMRPYIGAVSKEVGSMTSSIAKQVSQSAMRPTSVRTQERPASEKSIAELEAELGVYQA